MLVTIKDRLFKDIQSYCSINGLDIETYINDILKKSFMIEKYGEKPCVKPVKEKTEPINEPIKTEIVETKKTKPIQIVKIRQEDITEREETAEPVKEKHRKLTKK